MPPAAPGMPFGNSNDSNTVAFQPPQPARRITLKNRFVLDETLGVGGMGVVYKAIDKRKVEAKDRNPYIAVKILSEDFRQHPDAFMALQREARKSQSIAHPNIVNVHDFDRDGDIVFMTMEYMEGTPLDKLLKANKNIGLPKAQAERIMKDMCAALEHAHKEYIIHADFKPGNIFVTNSGVTKVFDFGVARAVAQVDRQVQHHDKSIFDPETLGALTPAYASQEMLHGANPTMQDDVYALGCVVYEMFAGHHPYNRVQADIAMEQKLKPKRIKSLSKQQWNALKKTLEFKRELRTSSVYEFLWDFTHEKKSPFKKWLAITALIAIGVGVYWQYFYTRPLTPEELRAQLEQQIKIDLVKKRLSELLQDKNFSSVWEANVWEQVQSGRELMGLKDEWLIDTEGQVVKIYLSQISQQRKRQRFTVAMQLLENAGRYRGYGDRLDNERSAINTALAKIREQQRLAEEKRRLAEEQRRKELEEQRAKVKKSVTAAPLKPKPEVLKPRDAFALAMNNIKQQLRCTSDIHTRDLETAVHQARKIDARKFKQQQPPIVTALSVCIEKIGRKDSNRAEDLKSFALRLFPGERALSSIHIRAIDPCNVGKAGLGARSQTGTCRDRFASGEEYGPRLVVVPKGPKYGPFAIGQYEVSVEQMNEYCAKTHDCKIMKVEGNIPVTNISFTQATSYANWLSKNTGYRYRIPRKAEWLYAATAQRGDMDANRNCSLQSRGIKKGESLEDITTGKKNMWGLVNYVGNAQEWVLENNRNLMAVGGARTDPIDQCTLATQRKHSGKPDSITGFRLLRELRN